MYIDRTLELSNAEIATHFIDPVLRKENTNSDDSNRSTLCMTLELSHTYGEKKRKGVVYSSTENYLWCNRTLMQPCDLLAAHLAAIENRYEDFGLTQYVSIRTKTCKG